MISRNILRAALTLLSAILLTAVIEGSGVVSDFGKAQAHQTGKASKIGTKLTKEQLQTLRAFVKGGSSGNGNAAPPIGFKVRANFRSFEVCFLLPTGINCGTETRLDGCPGEVTVKIPGGGEQTVPVNCEGPDSQGFCECEFAQ